MDDSRRVEAAYKPATALDVSRFIDDRPISRYQLLVAGLCAAVVCLDGFDAQVMGYVAPMLARELHVPRVALGSVISSGTLGMMIGALVFGPFADRVGRKPVLVASSLIFGVGSLMTAAAATVAQLTLCRVLTGFGLGGAMPNAIALTSEYMPKRSRNTAVMTMFCGFAFGSALAGWVSAAVLGTMGWRAVFVVGGSIPIVVAIALVAYLPESIRFLLVRRGRQSRVFEYLSRIEPGVPAPRELTVQEEYVPPSLGELFAGRRGGATLLLWLVFFMNLLDLWFLNNWLPTILNDTGIATAPASLIGSLFQVGGVAGSLALAGALGARLSFGVLAGIYGAAAVAIVLIGASGAFIPSLAIAIFFAGTCIIGGQTASNALAAAVYPTPIRATGVGWALGIGRIGSILGPVLGGVLLSYAGTADRIFWVAAVPPLVAAGAAASFGSLRPEDSQL